MPIEKTRKGDPVYCPDCKPIYGKSGRRITGQLRMVESNFSGTGVDYMECPSCGHVFSISYVVDQIIRDKSWESIG